MPATRTASSCTGCADALHLEAALRFEYRGVRWWLEGPLLWAVAKFAERFDLEPCLLGESEGPGECTQLIGVGTSRIRLRCLDSAIEVRVCCGESHVPHAVLLERIVRATRPAAFDVQLIAAPAWESRRQPRVARQSA